MMHHDPVPLVISDLRMPQMDGVTLLREILARWPDTAVIVVTAVAEVESAVACLRSEEHTSELQSQSNLVCRLLLEKKTLHDRSGSRSVSRPPSSVGGSIRRPCA